MWEFRLAPAFMFSWRSKLQFAARNGWQINVVLTLVGVSHFLHTSGIILSLTHVLLIGLSPPELNGPHKLVAPFANLESFGSVFFAIDELVFWHHNSEIGSYHTSVCAGIDSSSSISNRQVTPLFIRWRSVYIICLSSWYMYKSIRSGLLRGIRIICDVILDNRICLIHVHM